MRTLFCETALLHVGWARDVLIEIGGDGNIAGIRVGAERGDAPSAAGPVLPGMPNLHSHAFQRAMAGLAERRGPRADSFWTWREVMYGFVARLTPDQIAAIAAQVYVEMLKSGYTAVAEFHYLHHQPDGSPYGRPAEISERVIDAALEVGLGITHLPVLYMQDGFGGAPPTEGQRRFVNDLDAYLGIVDDLSSRHAGDPRVRIGGAAHSLRAVGPEALSAMAAALDERDGDAPLHLHIAEQQREVEECMVWTGRRPVEWLLDHADVSPRWCLVHATHMSEEETRRLAVSGAIAGLCPTTEANLGDGIFPARDYLAAGGAFGIGSDSHVSVSPAEELRWLEYTQRLLGRERNLLVTPGTDSTGASLYGAALAGGARACGRAVGALAPGHRADLVVLDGDHPALVDRRGDQVLDSYVFAGPAELVRDVMVGGEWVVEEGRHGSADEIASAYCTALSGCFAFA